MRSSPIAVPSQNVCVSGVGMGTGPADTCAPFVVVFPPGAALPADG
jgi:hypothetical protein